MTGGVFTDIIERPEAAECGEIGQVLMTPDVTFVVMLRFGILALQLLPVHSTSGSLASFSILNALGIRVFLRSYHILSFH